MVAKIMPSTVPSAVSDVVYALANGGIVIAPTETCYGLLADATNPKAVEKVYALKGREFKKPLSVFVFDQEELGKYGKLNPNAIKLVKKYLPGPLTLILKKKKPNKLAKKISKGDTIAFRISSHPFIIALSYNFGKPITATSANLSGKPEIYSFEEAKRLFGNKVDLIIDGGNLPKLPPTTIVDCSGKKLKVLRQGLFEIKL